MRKKIIRYLFGLIALIILVVLACNLWVLWSARPYLYGDVDDVPDYPVALILGTSKSLDGRYLNPYFADRITAGTELYRSGKVRHLIVSGDNSVLAYNEPRDMRQALIENGIPAERISMDFAGFRTFDSVVRCAEIFGQSEIVIVSQPFHTPRAVFIARRKGMAAVAYNARDEMTNLMQPLYWREVLARCKTIVDLYILRKKPKYLGEKIQIEIPDKNE